MRDAQLAANRCDFGDEILAHPVDDEYHRARSPVWEKITVPFLSAANWGGQGLHPRGNFRRLHARRVETEVAGSARPRALDPFLHRLRRQSAEAVLRSFPQGRVNGLGSTAARATAGAPRRSLRRAPRARVADRAHALDQTLPGYCRHTEPRALEKRRCGIVRRPRRGAHVPVAPHRGRDGNHRTARCAYLYLVFDRRRGPFPRLSRVHARSARGRVHGRDRSAHADRARLAARVAPQARSESCRRCGARITHTTQRSR